MGSLTRRSFIAATATTLAGFCLSGCASTSTSTSSSAAASAGVPAIEIKKDAEQLAVVVNLKDTKISPIGIALQKGYYEQEMLTIEQHPFGGGFP